ncbi:Uncharacterized protein HZ326_25007 [Fusarium oxysporum f. sp. albedinis]|nr:Uncharacterized protein HZ326_25007 [Fusarium oxysporum f. sp. albedinis]
MHHHQTPPSSTQPPSPLYPIHLWPMALCPPFHRLHPLTGSLSSGLAPASRQPWRLCPQLWRPVPVRQSIQGGALSQIRGNLCSLGVISCFKASIIGHHNIRSRGEPAPFSHLSSVTTLDLRERSLMAAFVFQVFLNHGTPIAILDFVSQIRIQPPQPQPFVLYAYMLRFLFCGIKETSQYAPVRPSFYIHKPEKYAAPKKETCSAHDPAFAPVHK